MERGTALVRSYISGVSFRVGLPAPIEGLFASPPGDAPGIDFFRARGLQTYCAQVESTREMCRTTIQDAMRKADVHPASLGAVVVDADNWHCTPEDRIQILESLLGAGIARVPVIGVSLQTCSGCMTAIGLADRLVRTDEERKPVLVLLCGRAPPGSSRIDARRATVLSDGVSACVVSATPGMFELLATTTRTNLEVARSAAAGEKAAISLVLSYRDIAAVANTLYEAAQITPEQIATLFCTNGNLMYASFAARAAGVIGSRTYIENVAAYGHVFSCDHLINLVTYGANAEFQPGQKYLLVGWSPYVFSGAILSYVGGANRQKCLSA